MSTRELGAPLLDEQICFALYSASRAITAKYREVLEPLSLTYPQYLVLLVLWQEGAVTVSHLGERLALESGTLSPLLKRLETSGLVSRQRVPSDERSVLISLTREGDALRSQVSDIPAMICDATGLTAPEVAGLRAQVRRLAGNTRGGS